MLDISVGSLLESHLALAFAHGSRLLASLSFPLLGLALRAILISIAESLGSTLTPIRVSASNSQNFPLLGSLATLNSTFLLLLISLLFQIYLTTILLHLLHELSGKFGLPSLSNCAVDLLFLYTFECFFNLDFAKSFHPLLPLLLHLFSCQTDRCCVLHGSESLHPFLSFCLDTLLGHDAKPVHPRLDLLLI